MKNLNSKHFMVKIFYSKTFYRQNSRGNISIINRIGFFIFVGLHHIHHEFLVIIQASDHTFVYFIACSNAVH